MTYDFRRTARIGAIGAFAVFAAVVIGHAAIPGSGGVISACYNTSSNPAGALRVIDAQAGAKCAKNEKLLTFNQTGAQGPQGLKGDPGTNGTNGTNGTDGVDGADGAAGPQGPAGPAGVSTATFAGATDIELTTEFTKVASKNLPEGAWVIFGTANIDSGVPFDGDVIDDVSCQLRSGINFIGGATDRRTTPDGQMTKVSLSMNGGAQIAPGGGEVSLWCSAQGLGTVRGALMTMLQIGGFS